MPTARILPVCLLLTLLAACNRTPQGVACAPLKAVSRVRVAQQQENGSSRQFSIANKYQVEALVDFANRRRAGFSARRKALPAPATTATFFQGSDPLLTFGAGANFFSLSCTGWEGVEEANRVQIAEFERLLAQQP